MSHAKLGGTVRKYRSFEREGLECPFSWVPCAKFYVRHAVGVKKEMCLAVNSRTGLLNEC